MIKRIAILAAVGMAALSTVPAGAQTALVVAGGGGGGGYAATGANGSATTSGTAGTSLNGTGGAGGAGGMGGAGGNSSDSNGGGGAGLLSAGKSGAGSLSGGGGQSSPSYAGGLGAFSTGSAGFGNGGFGGGGGGGSLSAGGGGGGYSGGGGAGGGGVGYNGGGGGSYLDPSLTPVAGLPVINPGNTASIFSSSGFITINFLDAIAPLTQTFSYTGAIQSYTFMTTGLYQIIAAGARGGTADRVGGFGAELGGMGTFTANSTLDLLVGGGGSFGGFRNSGGGGGGGSFVFLTYAAPDAPVAAAVPETATWAMMIVGMGGVGVALRRRRTNAIHKGYAA